MKMNMSSDPVKSSDERKMEALRASGEKFRRMVVPDPDVKESARLVEEHAGQDFYIQFGAEMEMLQRERQPKDDRAAVALEDLEALERKRQETPSYHVVPAPKGTGEKDRWSFATWTLYDQFVFCGSLGFMVVALAAGAGNVYSAIQAEAIPVFLEHPFLAGLLSCLLPAGSVAMHAFSEFLETDRMRERYSRLMAVLTVLLLVLWAITFAQNFQIGDDSLSLESLAGPANHTSVLFTGVQLLSELFCGTTLALVCSKIHRRYSQERAIPNPEAQFLDQRIAQLKARHEAAQLRQRAWGRLEQLNAMRAQHVTEEVAAFRAMRRRYEELNRMVA